MNLVKLNAVAAGLDRRGGRMKIIVQGKRIDLSTAERVCSADSVYAAELWRTQRGQWFSCTSYGAVVGKLFRLLTATDALAWCGEYEQWDTAEAYFSHLIEDV